MLGKLLNETSFTVADTIIWKKSNSIPHPASYNRLNRIVEFVYVIVRKKELKTFNCYKKVSKISPKGQKYYEIVDNFILAKNNDGVTELNKATYSSDFCIKLLTLYTKENDLVYDPFMGSGTTAKMSILLNRQWIGSEIDESYAKISDLRIEGLMPDDSVINSFLTKKNLPKNN
jgi:DNA modification methylase